MRVEGNQVVFVGSMPLRWSPVLTMDDVVYLNNHMDVSTKEQFIKLREWQKANNVECFECEEIEHKIAAFSAKAKACHKGRRKSRESVESTS